ncbi:MAG: hydrogenobyrinic acid a,c-diamide synthase (glutamine-hydrolyzing) [Candidatus Verstraetearchaeota archaeon]|nr:hydrogenobyrinic acid a,c-diamide synthase (glutamine-hydrolyzing) [Candidatus Verstraetearchaeota archaeon]
MRVPRIILSAGGSDSGKTIVTAALLRILSSKGYKVQPFKVGPDYIDPMFLKLAAGRPCRSLDSWIMDKKTVLSSFVSGSITSDIAVVEGVRGLYEGESPVGDRGSTAHIAKIIKSPVIIVLNCHSLTRSAAALLMGLKAMDRQVSIAGVILNKVKDIRHEEKLKRAISHYTNIAVLGCLYRTPFLEIKKRHIGLTMPHETPEVAEKIKVAAELLEENLELEAILEIAKTAPPIEQEPVVYLNEAEGIVVGVFMDGAFSFYYHENLSILKEMGAKISVIDSLSDQSIKDEISGLIIGGGYPELFSKELEENAQMRRVIKERIMDGLPVIGECGGLMYLCRSIEWAGVRRSMVGIFDGDVIMHQEPQALSYVELESVRSSPIASTGRILRGHEFHYSSIQGISSEFAFRVLRGKGIRDRMDGAVCQSAVGMYTHLHYSAFPEIPAKFLSECKAYSHR